MFGVHDSIRVVSGNPGGVVASGRQWFASICRWGGRPAQHGGLGQHSLPCLVFSMSFPNPHDGT